jgi:TonB family protein
MTTQVEAGIQYESLVRSMNNTEAWKTWEGRTVDGKFPLRRWLGGSDHSAVFLTDLGGPQKAVIKLIAASLNADRQLSRWAIAAKLSHPHLIRVLEMGRCRFDGIPLLYLVMEYAEENLSQILPQRPLTPAEMGDMLSPVLDALSYLHSRSLVHSRLRPSNILAVADQLKLSTDGISARGESDDKPASLDIYQAPEIAKGEIAPAIDVWALGVTLVVALTQTPPISRAKEQKDPLVPETIPEPFRSIARECLHLQLKQRCTIADIKAWRPPQQPAPPPEVVSPAPVKASGTSWRMLIPIAVLVIAILGARLVTRIFPSKISDPTRQVTNDVPFSPAPTQSPAPPAPTPTPAPAPRNTSPGNTSDVARQVLPDVPQSAKNTITGHIKVTVRLQVDASGKVTNATLTHPGPSQYFANLALKAARSWEFAPPLTNGQPTTSTWIVRFEFSRTGTKAFPTLEPH